MFQHGLDPNVSTGQERYFFDSDFYALDVESAHLKDMLAHFNSQSYRLFEWAIGNKAREHMNSVTADKS